MGKGWTYVPWTVAALRAYDCADSDEVSTAQHVYDRQSPLWRFLIRADALRFFEPERSRQQNQNCSEI
jgi:hypothetical protein